VEAHVVRKRSVQRLPRKEGSARNMVEVYGLYIGLKDWFL